VSSYVALLRGVNLTGSSTLAMSELKALAADLGLGDVRTYIASGNLLFTSGLAEEPLRAMLEERLSLHTGKRLPVVVRTAEELAAVVRANPFPDVSPRMVQAFFLNQPPPAGLHDTVRNRDDERIGLGTREVYVAYGEKGIGRSRLRIPAAEEGTARNMNTVAKLAELAKEFA
jgi:uncharacterized protein (DUF1697 family)